ncbi:hypothetical protein L226DRAFT_567509 [Lentinus tigrinus ALCF2SS1-7]|uniref:Uncharacterized protein n=1 Tax=Lentinus tigrinus ALCF2SS1-6 TaxID=1328759 RepID=A0A5C2SPF1_9APHY|nr:hypothetical protein L227DRAFT_204739 [Lentinus tigrinus ALCF2SS1-6]RPD79387.1 hypothetical protein L226DRAFT_567509 [Lentinus tigrinus ALCF2SS1-7]
MALDLLSNEGTQGKVERRYRHDLEGFVWTLPWIFAQWDEENEFKLCEAMLGWQSAYNEYVLGAKISFLQNKAITPQPGWADQWELARKLVLHVIGQYIGGLRSQEAEASDAEQYEAFWCAVRQYFAKGCEDEYNAIRAGLGL